MSEEIGGNPPRAVVDANFLINATRLTKQQRDRGERPAEYAIIEAFQQGHFAWVWTPEILDDYQRGKHAFMRKRESLRIKGSPTLDVKLFNYTLSLIRSLGYEAPVTEDHWNDACDALCDLSRANHLQDEDDADYLAAAEASIAVALLSGDSDIVNIGREYRGTVVTYDLMEFLRLVGFVPHAGGIPSKTPT